MANISFLNQHYTLCNILYPFQSAVTHTELCTSACPRSARSLDRYSKFHWIWQKASSKVFGNSTLSEQRSLDWQWVFQENIKDKFMQNNDCQWLGTLAINESSTSSLLEVVHCVMDHSHLGLRKLVQHGHQVHCVQVPLIQWQQKSRLLRNIKSCMWCLIVS